jgi:hypothetical protein
MSTTRNARIVADTASSRGSDHFSKSHYYSSVQPGDVRGALRRRRCSPFLVASVASTSAAVTVGCVLACAVQACSPPRRHSATHTESRSATRLEPGRTVRPLRPKVNLERPSSLMPKTARTNLAGPRISWRCSRKGKGRRGASEPTLCGDSVTVVSLLPQPLPRPGQGLDRRLARGSVI